MGHASLVPEVARQYFVDRGVLAHPTIGETFKPGQGWRRYPGRKHISYTEVARLRREGVTSIALRAGGRLADFGTRELSARAGITNRQAAALLVALAEANGIELGEHAPVSELLDDGR